MKNSDRTASPVECCIIDNGGDYIGLTKREHFAGLAMQGLLANSVVAPRLTGASPDGWPKLIADMAYEMADLMVEEK